MRKYVLLLLLTLLLTSCATKVEIDIAQPVEKTTVKEPAEITKEEGKLPQAGQISNKEKYCEKDADCVCGVNINTEKCFYGNKRYVDTTRQCPDFCTGITGKFAIKCINNQCIQKGEEIAEENTIEIKGNSFYPKEKIIEEDIEIKWINKDKKEHKIACYLKGTRVTTSPNLKEEGSFTYTFSQEGEYTCIDAIYGLRSTIIVNSERALLSPT